MQWRLVLFSPVSGKKIRLKPGEVEITLAKLLEHPVDEVRVEARQSRRRVEDGPGAEEAERQQRRKRVEGGPGDGEAGRKLDVDMHPSKPVAALAEAASAGFRGHNP